MVKKEYELSTVLLFRVGEEDSIKNNYDNNFIEFGCAANWIDYSLKNKDSAIGDYYECIFGHLKAGDGRLKVSDAHGYEMRDNLFMLYDGKDNSYYLRYMPTILMPALCFYSLSKNQILGNSKNFRGMYSFNLKKYAYCIGYDNTNVGCLIIKKPDLFVNELRKQIPIAVEEQKCILSSEMFYGSFLQDEPVIFSKINYDKFLSKKYFIDNENPTEEIFWKRKKFEWQSEVRFVIPHIHFAERYSQDSYRYDTHRLKIELPNLHSYAEFRIVDNINKNIDILVF